MADYLKDYPELRDNESREYWRIQLKVAAESAKELHEAFPKVTQLEGAYIFLKEEYDDYQHGCDELDQEIAENDPRNAAPDCKEWYK